MVCSRLLPLCSIPTFGDNLSTTFRPFWHLSTLLHRHFGQQPLAGQLASTEHCHSEQKSFRKVPDFGRAQAIHHGSPTKDQGSSFFSCPNLTPKQSGLFVTQRNHFEASSKQVGQNSVDELWPKRHCRVLRVQDDPRSKMKTENPTAAKRLAIAMSISTMPTTGFTTTWTKSNLKSTKVDESIYPKKMIDGHSIRPDGNPPVHFYESFCWEGVWLSIIQYGSITMSGDKKIYLTNCARHHMLQRCWHALHSGILRMPLSTKGKEDVEQNLSSHHHSFTINHDPPIGCLSIKTHLSPSVQLPATFRVSTSKAPRTRYHPQRLPWWWPVQSSPGEHRPHPEGARQCQHLAVLVKSWAKTAGYPNDWIVFVNPCWALALVGASAVPAATPCGKNLSCNWNATKKCMDEKIEKEISPKIAGKNWPENILKLGSVCVIMDLSG